MEFEMKPVTSFSRRCYVTVNCFNYGLGDDRSPEALKTRLNQLLPRISQFRYADGELTHLSEESMGGIYMIAYDTLEDYEPALIEWDRAHTEYRGHATRLHHTFEVNMKRDKITEVHAITKDGHPETKIPKACDFTQLMPKPLKEEEIVRVALARHLVAHTKTSLTFKETLAAVKAQEMAEPAISAKYSG